MFKGFERPKSNYFKMPNVMIELMSQMSCAELKVVLYIMRHTWGFSEYEKPKKISLDEFVNGRKRKDGTRLDVGCGLSLNSVRKGLDDAVENGYLDVIVDDRDKGRIRKCYRIKLYDDTVAENATVDLHSSKNCYPDSQNLRPSLAENANRTEKDTLRKTTRERHLQSTAPRHDGDRPSPSAQNGVSGFVDKNDKVESVQSTTAQSTAVKLANGLKARNKIMRNFSLTRWTSQIDDWIKQNEVDEKRLSTVLDWYVSHIGEEYVPQAYSASTFVDKFINIESAMQRHKKQTGGIDQDMLQRLLSEREKRRACSTT